MMTPDSLEVTIERILPGGLGLAHAEGRTVMVALAAPGDRLRVQIDRIKGSVSFASIQKIITPSPQRIAPPCPYFGRCGGCDFQQLTYEAQLETKKEIIRDCLRRIGGIQSHSTGTADVLLTRPDSSSVYGLYRLTHHADSAGADEAPQHVNIVAGAGDHVLVSFQVLGGNGFPFR